MLEGPSPSGHFAAGVSGAQGLRGRTKDTDTLCCWTLELPGLLQPRVLGRSSSGFQQLRLYRSHGNAAAVPLQETPPAPRPLWATSPGAKEQPPSCPEATIPAATGNDTRRDADMMHAQRSWSGEKRRAWQSRELGWAGSLFSIDHL